MNRGISFMHSFNKSVVNGATQAQNKKKYDEETKAERNLLLVFQHI